MADDVQELIDDARQYAANTVAAGVNAMDQAIAIVQGLGAGFAPNQKLPNLEITVPAITIPTPAPTLPTGAIPQLDPFPDNIDAPTLGYVPGYSPPVKPTILSTTWDDLEYDDPRGLIPVGVPQFNATAPVLPGTPTIPAAPPLEAQIQGLQFPTIVPITIPAAPTYVAPVFSAQAPLFNATMPTGLDVLFEQQFSNASPIMQGYVNAQLNAYMTNNFPAFASGMAAIEARLATYLAGGTGLTPAVEDALYTRTLDKTNKDAVRAMEQAMGKSARLGMTMVSPVLLSEQMDIDNERRLKNAMAATEIYTQQAQLEQKNIEFAVKASNELRQIALTAAVSYYHGLVSINQQALEYARGVVDAVVKAFDVAARYAEVQTRIYEAAAQVYRAQLDGALAVLRAYESTVRGLEAQANVDRALVDAFRAQIDAIKAEADVYTSQINAVVAIAKLSEIQVQLFDSQVKAFASQVNALSAQWMGYKAAVEGQEARMNVNIGHAKEYEAAANAYAAEVKAAELVVTSAVQVNKELVDIYRAQIEAYAALEHSKIEAAQVAVLSYDAQLKGYIANCQAAAEQGRANVASFEAGFRGLVEEARMILEQLKESNMVDIERVKGVAQISQTIGHVYAGLAESSLSGMNTLAANVNNTTT